MPHQPELITSRGETGIELASLVAAQRLGIKTGGFASPKFETSAGEQPILGERFHLVESSNAFIKNIRETDLTIAFCQSNSLKEQLLSRAETVSVMVFSHFLTDMIADIQSLLTLQRPKRINFYSDLYLSDTAGYASMIETMFSQWQYNAEAYSSF
jgi:hypothetical protein